MPELPEVRAHAERLHAAFGGAALDKFTALSFHALKTFDPPPDAAIGRPLTAVRQRGKYLLLDFTPITFVIHLMQGGRLRVDEKQAAKVRGGLARLIVRRRASAAADRGRHRSQGRSVGAGRRRPDAGSTRPPRSRRRHRDRRRVGAATARHEFDAAARMATRASAARRSRSPPRQRDLLAERDSRRLPIPASSVATTSSGLHAGIRAAVDEGLAYERTRDDMSASKDRPGAVHGRTKLACPRCGDIIRAVEYSNYTVNYCATCQTGGKILADNTTSRFLK